MTPPPAEEPRPSAPRLVALVDELVEKLRQAELLAGQIQGELAMPGDVPPEDDPPP